MYTPIVLLKIVELPNSKLQKYKIISYGNLASLSTGFTHLLYSIYFSANSWEPTLVAALVFAMAPSFLLVTVGLSLKFFMKGAEYRHNKSKVFTSLDPQLVRWFIITLVTRSL